LVSGVKNSATKVVPKEGFTCLVEKNLGFSLRVGNVSVSKIDIFDIYRWVGVLKVEFFTYSKLQNKNFHKKWSRLNEFSKSLKSNSDD